MGLALSHQNKQHNCLAVSSLVIRSYPKAFALKILRLYEDKDAGREPRKDLRNKVPLGKKDMTDRELFRNMEHTDLWTDAGLPQVLLYAASNRHMKIPDTWEVTFKKYIQEVQNEVAWPHIPLLD